MAGSPASMGELAAMQVQHDRIRNLFKKFSHPNG
jgi:hypothetical protein